MKNHGRMDLRWGGLLIATLAACSRPVSPPAVSANKATTASSSASPASSNRAATSPTNAQARVIEIIANQRGVAPSNVDLDESLMKTFENDVVAIHNIIKTFERDFSVKLSSQVIGSDHTKSVGDSFCGRDMVKAAIETQPIK